jgi:hypothetical protein
MIILIQIIYSTRVCDKDEKGNHLEAFKICVLTCIATYGLTLPLFVLIQWRIDGAVMSVFSNKSFSCYCCQNKMLFHVKTTIFCYIFLKTWKISLKDALMLAMLLW